MVSIFSYRHTFLLFHRGKQHMMVLTLFLTVHPVPKRNKRLNKYQEQTYRRPADEYHLEQRKVLEVSFTTNITRHEYLIFRLKFSAPLCHCNPHGGQTWDYILTESVFLTVLKIIPFGFSKYPGVP